jgi:hypothetical protein
MSAPKLTRRALALRLFAAAVVINSLLLLFFWPSPSVEEKSFSMAADELEMQIKAQLHLPFEKNQIAMLLKQNGETVGPVKLVARSEEHVTLWLARSLYQEHFRALIHDEWALIPVVKITPTRKSEGVRYEIAY